MKITNYKTEPDTPPAVTASVDLSEHITDGELEMTSAVNVINTSGGLVKSPSFCHVIHKSAAVIVSLADGTTAVTSPEGLAAYLARTGQTEA